MDNRRETTNEIIKNAFISLVKKQGPDNITVKSICELCHINRSTFYDHYGYMENLVEEVLKQEIYRICDFYDSYSYLYKDSDSIPKELIKAYIFNLSQSELIFSFLSSSKSAYYEQKIITLQTELTLGNLKKDEQSFYRAYFQNIGATSTILKWIEKGEILPLDELIDIINSFSITMYQ